MWSELKLGATVLVPINKGRGYFSQRLVANGEAVVILDFNTIRFTTETITKPGLFSETITKPGLFDETINLSN